MGKKSIINAIKQIELDSGSWDDDQLEQLQEMDLKELKGILKDYDPGLTDQYTKKKSKPTKVATAKHGGLAKRGYGVARRG